MEMEKKLRNLFDYQRFSQNPRLAELIERTERKYSNELSDDDLELVNAAGEISSDNNQTASGPKPEDSGNV